MKFRILLAALAVLLAPGIPGVRAQDAGPGHLAWMLENLPECPAFESWIVRTGALPPDFKALPRTNLLPDAFTFADGSPVVTDEDWERRRAEILDLFIRYEFGTLPPRPAIWRVEVLEDRENRSGRTLNVCLWFGPDIRSSVRASVTIPAGEPGTKYPVVLSPRLGGLGGVVLQRGYISAGFAASDDLDDSRELRDVYRDCTFSKLTRRAWLAGIVLDWLETLPEVDPERIALYGYSRDGKMAAIAAALDSRIAALVAGRVVDFFKQIYISHYNGVARFKDKFVIEEFSVSDLGKRIDIDLCLVIRDHFLLCKALKLGIRGIHASVYDMCDTAVFITVSYHKDTVVPSVCTFAEKLHACRAVFFNGRQNTVLIQPFV